MNRSMPSIAAHTRVSLENTRMYSTTTESLPRSTTSSTIARMASPAPNVAVLPLASPNKPLTEDKYNYTESATKQGYIRYSFSFYIILKIPTYT